MRTVDSHLVDKMDEAVTHYINSHHHGEVHVDTNGLPISVQDDGGGRVVTVMHSQGYPSQMCRQVAVNEAVGEGQWGEELLDTDGRLAALVAHLSRASHHQSSHHKMPVVRDMDTSVILDAPMRIFNGQSLDPQGESIIVEVPQLSPLPSLQDMKRCQGTDWFNKTKGILKDNSPILAEGEGAVLEVGASASPAQHKHSKKSLPHKKRISRKLKRNGGTTPQQDIVVINCSEEVPQEILPDNFVATVQHQEQLQVHTDTHHIAHEMRAIFICQLCGEFYGEDQLKFFHHLKQHYEPHSTIIIENPVSVPDLGIDKMTNTCIVDNVATLPDSIVELSLENTVPKTMYQPIDKHILYTSSDKTLNYSTNKLQYSVAGSKDDGINDKADLYETLDKLDMNYDCAKCHKSMKKHHRPCETHSKEVSKLDDMGEFSEPEDLMEGIHVSVEGEQYAGTLLPHLTVDNGHVHQEHVRLWYMRANGSNNMCSAPTSPGYCPVCPAREHDPFDPENAPRQLKEEMLQRMLEVEVPTSEAEFTHNIIPEEDLPPPPPEPAPPPQPAQTQLTQAQNAQTQNTQAQNAQAQNAQNIQMVQPQMQSVQNVEINSVQSQVQTENSQNIQIHSVHSLNVNTQTDIQPNEAKTRVKREQDASKKSPKRFECLKCGRVLKHRNSLLYHMLSHSEKQQACRECGKEFYTASALKAHRRVHNDDRPYKCEHCSRAFRQWSVLKYHQSSIHSKQKLFKCEFCNKEFARKYSLNLHRRIHTGEYNYKCDYCNKSFRASSYRLTHMRTHTGDKPYKCDECDKCFRATSDLRRHIKTHEKMRSRLEEKNKPKPKDKKPKAGKDKPEPTEEIKTENNQPEQNNEKPTKNYAAASTAKVATLKNSEKIKVTKKIHKKDGAPNVTVMNRLEGHKIGVEYTNNVEVFDTRQGNVEYKFKDVYTDHSEFKDEINVPNKSSVLFKNDINMSEERDFAILRPIFRTSGPVDNHEVEKVVRSENTDGKMQVFTHVEKVKEYSSALGVSRTETMTNGEENTFLERLTALYNIPAI